MLFIYAFQIMPIFTGVNECMCPYSINNFLNPNYPQVYFSP